MAGEEFLVRVALDANNVPASLLSIANAIAGLKGEIPDLDKQLTAIEGSLVKMAQGSEAAATAANAQASEMLKLNETLYTQAQAYERLDVATQLSVDGQQVASKQTAIYNQYLYDQAVALNKSAASLDAHVIAFDANNAAMSVASRQTALYDQYLYDEAIALNKSAVSLDAHVLAFEANNAALSVATKQTALYDQYLYDEAIALGKTSVALDAHVIAFDANNAALSVASKQTAIYNQYLYDEAAAQAKATAASEKAAAAAARAGQNLSTTRYALFSSAQSLSTFGGVLLGISTLPAIVSTEFQKYFAQVTRTVSGAGEAVKQSLIVMSEQMPVTFKSLASIAALGGQLGIEKGGIVDFTRTVAELTATTNLTAEAAGTMLGRFQSLLGLPSDKFQNIASAILNVGVNTVATETQIVGISTAIAATARIAGFTAPQVVGLAGAMASLGDQTYLSRGVVVRSFGIIDNAISNSTPKVDEFAKVMGITAAQLKKDYGTSAFADDFTKLVVGLGKIKDAGGSVSEELKKLGLVGTNNVKVFQGLAVSSNELVKAQELSAYGYAHVGVLANQYGIIAATTSSKVVELGNSILAMFNSIGTAQQGPVNILVSSLSDIVNWATQMASTSIGQNILLVASVTGILVGVLALLGSVAARSVGGVIGLTQALAGFNARETESIGIVAAFRTELELTGAAGKAASVGIGIFGASLALVLPAILIFAGLSWVGQLAAGADAALHASLNINALKGSASSATSELDRFLKASNLTGFQSALGPPNTRTIGIKGASSATPTKQDPVAMLAQQTSVKPGVIASALDFGIAGRMSGVTQATEAIGKIDGALAKLVGSGNSDQASRLFSELQQRAKAGGQDVGVFSSQFVKFHDALNAAQGAITAVNAGLATQKDVVTSINDLTGVGAADQTKFAAAYQKSVAPLTDFNTIMGTVQQQMKDAATGKDSTGKPTAIYQDMTVSVDQFTAQLGKNNDAQDKWLANLIIIGQKANASVANSGPAITAQLVSAGYSVTNASFAQQLVDATPAQMKKYTQLQMDSIQKASVAASQALLLAGNIFTSDNQLIGADAALKLSQALVAGEDFQSVMTSLGLHLQDAAQKNPLPSIPLTVDPTPANHGIATWIRDNSDHRVGISLDLVGGSAPTVVTPSGPVAFKWGIPTFRAEGGPIYGPGTGTSDSIPAMLSNNEYVIRAASVQKYGTGIFDQLNRGVARFANGGPVGSAPSAAVQAGLSVVSLSASDKAILTWIGNQLRLSIDGKDIATASGAANLVAVGQRQVV